MQFTTFKNRVQHNTNVLKKCLEKGAPLTTILHQVYTWEYCPGEGNSYELTRNAYDIIPSLFLGSLASCTNNGYDGYRVDHLENVIPQEYKIGSYDRNMVWKGPQGGLKIGRSPDSNKSSCLRSYISGSYSIHSEANLKSKEVETFLCVFEQGGSYMHTFVDIYTMSGDIALKRLDTGSKSKKREIKLSAFIMDGRRASTTVELPGFIKEEEKLADVAPTFYEWAGVDPSEFHKKPAKVNSLNVDDLLVIKENAIAKLSKRIADLESGKVSIEDYNSSKTTTREWAGRSENGTRKVRAVGGRTYKIVPGTERVVPDNKEAIISALFDIREELSKEVQ